MGGFCHFDPRKLTNPHELKFHLDFINNKLFDTGSHTYHYLNNHPTLKVKKQLGEASAAYHHWDLQEIQYRGYNEDEIWLIKNLPWRQNVEFHMGKNVLHFGASSFEVEGYLEKEKYVIEFINRRLAR